MNTIRILAVHDEESIEAIESLAREIWTEHYTPIIGPAQVEYMLKKFQSQAAIEGQIRQGYLYYIMKIVEEPVGYFAIVPRGSELFLSKLYVKKGERRKGYAKQAFEFIKDLAREKKASMLALTVNKGNQDSIEAYKKMGFTVIGPAVQDIGNGFVMDDYRMEMKV